MQFCQHIQISPSVWSCPICGHIAKTNAKPGNRPCGVKAPNLLQKAVNFAGSQVTAAMDLYRHVTKEQAEERKVICRSNKCGMYDGTNNSCLKCGCPLSYKPEIRAWDCPLGFWPNLKPDEPKPYRIVPSAGGPWAWRGISEPKPWEYNVTAIIPVIEPDKSLVLVIELLRLQTERPYIVLVDTGSKPETCEWLETLRAYDVEIHYLKSHGTVHLAECVCMACDLGAARAETRFTFFTHADCFLTSRSALSEAMALAEKHIVAGHQITERDYAGWQQEVGHTFLMCDQDELDKRGITWKMRRGVRTPGAVPSDKIDDYTAEGLPKHIVDTERSFNRLIQASGIKAHFTGTEQNWKRNKDHYIDHVRSMSGSKLYSAEHHAQTLIWLKDATQEAQDRVTDWSYQRSKEKR